MNCQKCGADAPTESGFCPKCGASLTGGAEAAPAVERSAGSARFQDAVGERRGVADTVEQEIWKGSYSPKAMLGAWIITITATIAAVVLGVLFAAGNPVWWWPIGGAILALWVYQLFALLIMRLNVRYRLTNHRFFHERGILRRVTDRIEVIDMDDITFEQGIIERMVGVGTIRITSSDRTHPELSLKGIDDVRTVAGQLDDLRRAERMRRGLHIESI